MLNSAVWSNTVIMFRIIYFLGQQIHEIIPSLESNQNAFETTQHQTMKISFSKTEM